MYKVWYNTAIYFVSRGLAVHQQLRVNSFECVSEDGGQENSRLHHETAKRPYREGDVTGATSDKRLYTTGGTNCPIESLYKMLQLCNPDSNALFAGL